MREVKKKITILGQDRVGKTQLLNRLVGGEFSDEYQATIGIDFKTASYQHESTLTRIQWLDTAGQARFVSLLSSCCGAAETIIVVYHNAGSLQRAQALIAQYHQSVHEDNPAILVYNQFTSTEPAQADEFARAGEEWVKTQKNTTFHRVNVKMMSTPEAYQPLLADVCPQVIRPEPQPPLLDRKLALLAAFKTELNCGGRYQDVETQGISGWNILLPFFALFCCGAIQKSPDAVSLILQSNFEHMGEEQVTQTYDILKSKFQPYQGCFAMFSFRRKATQQCYDDFLARMNKVERQPEPAACV